MKTHLIGGFFDVESYLVSMVIMPIVHSSKIKKQAILLRRKGDSLRTIAKKLQISLSTAQLWTKEVILSEEQKQKIFTEHQLKLQLGQTKFREQRKLHKINNESELFLKAKNEIKFKKTDPFFILGLSLYWAEGFKKDHALGFINSDPNMVKIFKRWLERYGDYDDANIHPRVQIHEVYRDNIEDIQLYWSNILEIPTTQFQKPFYQKSQSQPLLIDPNYKGLLRIRISGTRSLFIKILGWLEGLKAESFEN